MIIKLRLTVNDDSCSCSFYPIISEIDENKFKWGIHSAMVDEWCRAELEEFRNNRCSDVLLLHN